ncbi:MAG: polysaccharide deacetylase family protein [Bacteroidia bacterium]
MKQKSTICITFDLEEFDLPLEYQQNITDEKQIEITTKGMDVLLPLLEKENISCTFFTTANYAQQKPELIKHISKLHEIASHSFFHSSFQKTDLKTSKEVLQNICGKEVVGFRMPRMVSVNYTDLKEAGYFYDSSLNPTFIPGRYNHFTASKIVFKKEELIVFPTTVTPTLRIPLFWLAFKNCTIKWYCRQIQKCLDRYGYVNLYFHPWEFADTSNFLLPKYINKDYKEMAEKLIYFINFFKEKTEFTTIRKQLGV